MRIEWEMNRESDRGESEGRKPWNWIYYENATTAVSWERIVSSRYSAELKQAKWPTRFSAKNFPPSWLIPFYNSNILNQGKRANIGGKSIRLHLTPRSRGSISSFPPGSVSHSPCSSRCSNPVPRRAGRVFRSLIESNPVKISHPGERGEKRQELTPSERTRRSHFLFFRGKPCW